MDNLLRKLMLGGSTTALVAAMSLTGANAQGGGEGDIEQVVVSASRITIAGYQQPTPVTVVGAAQLEKNAFSNIADAVRELPAVTTPPSSVGVNNGGAISGTEGAELLTLRNLGQTRTLILFDSQRIVQSNITGGVDINTIPSSVISRVDVVTGGASAAWGSDAVAGVVNFVLNKNYDGFKGDIELGDTYDNKYRNYKVDATWGGDIDGGRGHLVLAANYAGNPDLVTEDSKNWYRDSYWVSNPAFAAGNGQPQLIIANDVGLATANQGGLITSSPAVTAANSPSGVATAANALRGIEFVGAGIPQLVNFGNLTLNSVSNGGSLTHDDGENNWTPVGISFIRYTAFAFGRYKLTDTIQASLQLNYGYFSGKDIGQNLLQTALVIKSDNAFLPASVRTTMQTTGITSFTMGVIASNNLPENVSDANQYKVAEGALGLSTTTNQRQLMRGVFTLEGTLGEDWSWNTFYQHSTVRYWTHAWGNSRLSNTTAAEDAVTVTTANRGTSNLPLGSIVCRSSLTGTAVVVGTATAQPGCIPLDVFGNGVASPNAIVYATGHNTDFENMQLNQDEISGSMQGTLPWELPAGKVAVVFGAGYRKEAGVVFADPAGANADWAIGNWINFPSASYNVMEGFAEVDAPLIKNGFVDSLDFSMAGRMTSYSTSGLVETWKLGLTSQVNEDVKLRTTWSVDIRAPGLSDLFAVNSRSNSSIKDPKTQVTVSVFTDTQGNPNLVPEVARTITGGIVLTPHWVEGLSASLDYYSISLDGGISPLSSTVYLNECNPTIPSVIHPGQQGNPNDPLCTHLVFNGPGNPPSLAFIEQTPLNIASQTVSGFDIQANYTMDFWEGSLAWQAQANYQDENTTAQPGTATNDNAGTGGNPKWKGILAADYTTGPVSVTVSSRWYGTSKFINTANTGNLATPATSNLYPTDKFEIPFWAYLDLRGNYKWNSNISFYGAIDNIFNTPPALVPFASNTVIHSLPTNPSSYDLLGRQFRLGVRFNY
ncbi:MAG TPA: TonB-dependent receptor [Rhizomicrobium sp.]|nr:TonB-dependent receptor [Rhizomicrobium sp.]